MATRVVLLGPPGSGKGTQSALLAKSLGIAHISTGDMFRAAVQEGRELGERVKAILDAGHLVPDPLVIEIIRDRLQASDCRSGFVLDGYPRTVDQAKALTDLLEELQTPLTHVLELKVPQEILVQRVLARASGGSGRSDDNEEVFRNRLKVYEAQTKPVSEYYGRGGQIVEIDGLGSIAEVQARLLRAIKRA
jgi:adenylate kinase